mmetsp:Transcript_41461/g.104555  ORF Transcript_41461/g.104555 Transcript_41461/m.104555 type:complete len:200 (+) Transcript_41461:157-756(+)
MSGHIETTLLAHTHASDASIPALDHLSDAQPEAKVVAAVEHLAGLAQRSLVRAGHLLSLARLLAVAHAQYVALQTLAQLLVHNGALLLLLLLRCCACCCCCCCCLRCAAARCGRLLGRLGGSLRGGSGHRSARSLLGLGQSLLLLLLLLVLLGGRCRCGGHLGETFALVLRTAAGLLLHQHLLHLLIIVVRARLFFALR